MTATFARSHLPLDYTRDPVKRRITVTSTGLVTRAETLAVIDRQAAEGAWSYQVLYDARAGMNAPTEEDVRRMVLHVGGLTTRHGPRGPVALVVTDPQVIMMGGWYACLGELAALTFRVFKRFEEAEEWLEKQS